MHVKVLHQMVGHVRPIYCLSEGFNSGTILSGSSDRFVAEWDLKAGSPTNFSIKLTSIPYSLLPLQDRGCLLIGNSSGEIHFIDVAKKHEIKCLKVFSSAVFKLVSDGRFFYASSSEGELAIGSLDTIEIHKVVKVCQEKIRHLAIDFLNQTLLLSCGDGFTRLVALQTGNFIAEFQSHSQSTNCALLLPNHQLLTGGRDAHLNYWIKSNTSYQLKKSIPAHNFAIYDLAIAPNGETIATASRDKTIKLWNTNLDIPLRLDKSKFNGHDFSVNTLHWNKQTNLLLSAGDDRSIIVWKTD